MWSEKGRLRKRIQAGIFYINVNKCFERGKLKISLLMGRMVNWLYQLPSNTSTLVEGRCLGSGVSTTPILAIHHHILNAKYREIFSPVCVCYTIIIGAGVIFARIFALSCADFRRKILQSSCNLFGILILFQFLFNPYHTVNRYCIRTGLDKCTNLL